MIRCLFHSSTHNPEANAAAGEFVSRIIWGDSRGFSPHCSMSVIDGGTPVAAVIYHNLDPDAGVIEMSAGATSRRWLQRHVLRFMFGVAFDLLACQMAILRVSADNEAMISIARRFGFDEFRVPRLYGRGTDGLLFCMTDDKWRQHDIAKTPSE